MADDGFWMRALAEAEAADAADPLGAFRGRFRLPPGMIYLDGNSLGPAPEAALRAIAEAAEREWAGGLITSWNTAGWFELPTRLGNLVAKVIGAGDGEVVVSDTTTINVHKALHAGLSLRPGRSVVVAEAGSFPTDIYAASSLGAGVTLRLEGVDGPSLEGLIDETVAVVLVNQVDYRSGRRRDVAALTAKAHAAGAVVVWDLCHSAGVMPVGLNAADADLAVGCTYKYLNGGPGSPAFVFCAARHQAAVRQPLAGWWGHARPFAFEVGFEPAPDIRRFLCGTQPILSLRGLEAGLAIAAEADLGAVRAKSVALTERFIALAEAVSESFGVGLASPREAESRGSQVALTHPQGYAVMQALIGRGVVGDFREPDAMRFGFAPLYIRHVDVVRAVRTLEQVLAGRVWDAERYHARGGDVTALDLGFVRAQFPAFAEPSLTGQAFFENAGGSYPCRQVVDRLTRFYRSRKVQPYAPYAASRLAGAEMDEARERLAAMLGVATDELSFGPSTSANTYVLAQAFRGMLAPGDAIVVTDQDHEANSGVWRRLAADGIELREWRVDAASGALDPGALGTLLDGRVKLVCFPHCSNIVGEVNDVASVCEMVHSIGAVVCVDGVSYAPHGLPDVGALGADIYLFSTYKTYGPHQGAMVVRRALLDTLPNQGHCFNAGSTAKRLTPAGPDHAQVAACAGIADYVEAVHAHHFGGTAEPRAMAARVHDLQRAQETRLLAPLLDWLAARNDLRLIGPRTPAGRVPTVALLCARPGEAVAAALAGHGIMAGGGDFYAVRLLVALGIDPGHGVLRLSFVHYTHPDEVARAVAALDAVL